MVENLLWINFNGAGSNADTSHVCLVVLTNQLVVCCYWQSPDVAGFARPSEAELPGGQNTEASWHALRQEHTHEDMELFVFLRTRVKTDCEWRMFWLIQSQKADHSFGCQSKNTLSQELKHGHRDTHAQGMFSLIIPVPDPVWWCHLDIKLLNWPNILLGARAHLETWTEPWTQRYSCWGFVLSLAILIPRLHGCWCDLDIKKAEMLLHLRQTSVLGNKIPRDQTVLSCAGDQGTGPFQPKCLFAVACNPTAGSSCIWGGGSRCLHCIALVQYLVCIWDAPLQSGSEAGGSCSCRPGSFIHPSSQSGRETGRPWVGTAAASCE